VVTNYSTPDSVYHTYSNVARVVADDRQCNAQFVHTYVTAPVELATRYATPDTRL